MGVAVQGDVDSGRDQLRRFVMQVKAVTAALEGQGFRCEVVRIAVAADGVDAWAYGVERVEEVALSDIAEVPDFVGLGEGRSQAVGDLVVGVG